jgi:hypothetical protein
VPSFAFNGTIINELVTEKIGTQFGLPVLDNPASQLHPKLILFIF